MELFAADGHDAGGCERVTGKSGMRPRVHRCESVRAGGRHTALARRAFARPEGPFRRQSGRRETRRRSVSSTAKTDRRCLGDRHLSFQTIRARPAIPVRFAGTSGHGGTETMAQIRMSAAAVAAVAALSVSSAAAQTTARGEWLARANRGHPRGGVDSLGAGGSVGPSARQSCDRAV